MEQYAQILLIASPVFFILVIGEKLYGWLAKGDTFKSMDMISSVSSGFTNAMKDILGIGVSIVTYAWLVEKVAFIHIEFTWMNVLIAFIALDFAGYWGHRINHRYNFFWNQHLVHHSSEEFNLACALRQSISNLIGFFTIFLLPAALLGVDVMIIAIVGPIQFFAQFWYHTIYIGRMGFLEKIIVTPSHHRVHHAINPIYLDKNLGQVLIIWDKLFGTFQEELEETPPVYGITIPVRTWNPIKINFQHIWLLIQDAYHAKSWRDKFRIWLMPTGWRPSDVEKKYPVFKIDDPYHFKKFEPKVSNALIYWSWFQFVMVFCLLSYFFYAYPDLTKSDLAYYGVFLFVSVYAYTELMGRNSNSFWQELAKNGLGAYIVVQHGDWFGLSSFNELLNYFVLAYLIVSTLMAAYFSFVEFEKKEI